MLEIVIPEQHYELFDEIKEEFIKVDIKETKMQLEHSLISIKKWEQKWHKSFLKNAEQLSHIELIDYIRCMALSHGIDSEIYNWIPKEIIDEIVKYIRDPMSATYLNNNNLVGAQKNSGDTITAEVIYYWMITLGIPVEFQKWHLNQLLTLIKVVNVKNGKPIKKNPKIAAKERAALNAKRRAASKSKG